MFSRSPKRGQTFSQDQCLAEPIERLSRQRISILPSIFPALPHIDAHQHRDGCPDHANEEEERVANVPCRVRDYPHYERAEERT